MQQLLKKVDTFQQKHPAIAFPVAVILKFNDDQAGNRAALLAYYAFLSLFPLLLVLFTLLPVITNNDQVLQQRIIQAALDYFPVIGQDLKDNIHIMQRGGWALVIGLLIIFYGARGVAAAVQDTANALWQVPKKRRPGFPWNTLRNFGIIIVGGLGLLATTLTLGYITGVWSGGWFAKVMLAMLAFVLNTCVFLAINRIATATFISARQLLLGSAISAIALQLLQLLGSFLVLHQLKTADSLYGVFAVVLGLLFWLYLQAELYVYALEANVVKEKKLWPRSFIQQ